MRLLLRATIEHRLHIDDRCLVDGFERLDSETCRRRDFDNRDAMDADRVRSIRRACAEHSTKRLGWVIARVHFERGSITSMQPREDEHFVSSAQVAQSRRHAWDELEPRCRRALAPLFGRARRIL